MAEVHQNSAECAVFTFKEGLLSSVAHDLKLGVGRWSLALTRAEGGVALEGRWDAGSLTVAAVIREGREAPGVLGAKDLDKIARNVREDVLSSARYPEIKFSGKATPAGDTARIEGQLTLCGRSKTVSCTARLEGGAAGKWVAEVTIHQPDFGIKPYSAMLGALKIKADVKVRVAVPVAALGGEV